MQDFLTFYWVSIITHAVTFVASFNRLYEINTIYDYNRITILMITELLIGFLPIINLIMALVNFIISYLSEDTFEEYKKMINECNN